MNRERKSPSNDSEPRDVDLVNVVDRTALIENLLNQIVVSYCGPRKEAVEFMWSVVLDTSVMSIGAKVKIVMAVAQEIRFKLRKDALHTVMSLRNAFAHHATDSHVVFAIGAKPEDMHVYHQLWILGSSGKISRKRRDEALEEFNLAYRVAKESLVELRDVVRNRFEPNAA